jgi:CDP-ribitol ribitolphosphotransferase / teichoic acid ribitol-phosphate polymerase
MRVPYAIMKLLPVRHRVVFMSRQSNRPSLDFTMLADELRSRDPRIEVVTVCRTLGARPGDRVRYVGTTLVQMYHLARSRVCLLDGYSIPVSVLRHRNELTVVQMWHALGAVKKFGHQCLDTPSGRPSDLAQTMRMHANYDYVLCGGPAAVPVFAEAFGVDASRVKPLGLPRIDYLLQAAAASQDGSHPAALQNLIERHPEVLGGPRKRVLYAPTFRKGHATSLRALAENFDPARYTLIVKLHDLEDPSIGYQHLVDATGISVLDLLPLCDAVITDYSAVAFEACVLGKPVYYYVHDIAEYSRGCGLNIDPLRDAPRVSSTDIRDIVCRIDDGEYDQVGAQDFAARYLPTPVSGSTTRIADLVLARVETN